MCDCEPLPPPPPILIALGSTSPLKAKAVGKAFEGVEGATIQGCAAASGVSDQPCGIQETLLGANNRAQEAHRQIPNAHIIIAIENGMVYGHHTPNNNNNNNNNNTNNPNLPFIGGTPSPSGWTDVAAIVIITPNKEQKHHVVWSDHIAIPGGAVEECLPPSATKEAAEGREVHALITWSPLKDPHTELTGGRRPRAAFLSDALRGWVEANLL